LGVADGASSRDGGGGGAAAAAAAHSCGEVSRARVTPFYSLCKPGRKALHTSVARRTQRRSRVISVYEFNTNHLRAAAATTTTTRK